MLRPPSDQAPCIKIPARRSSPCATPAALFLLTFSLQSTFGTVSTGGGGSSTYNVGGAYRGGDSYTTPATSFGTAQGPYGSPQMASSSLAPESSGDHESKIVEAATQPTGVRAMPSRFQWFQLNS